MAVTPLAESCLLVQIAINYGFDLPEPQIMSGRTRSTIGQADHRKPAAAPLPLDLKEELRTIDKYCVAYRRWLKELGVTWGISQ